MKRTTHRLWWPLLLTLALFTTACARTAPSSWPGLRVHDDTLYVANQQHVYALSLPDGQVRWTFPAEADRDRTFFAAPTPAGDLLLVGGYDNVLYALDAQTGTERWTFTQARDRYIASPLAAHGRIYAPNADGTLYVLDEQGHLKWTFASAAALWAQPVLDNGRLYLASMDHTLYVLDPQSGQVQWQTTLPGALPAAPAVTEDGVFVAALAPVLTALEPEDGAVRWQQELQGWVWHQPVVADGLVVVADMQGTVYAFEAQGGEPRWTYHAGAAVVAQPAIHQGTLYIATQSGDLIALTWPEGQEQWRRHVQELEEDGFAGPILIAAEHELLFTPTMNSKRFFYAWTLDGTLRWGFPTEQ